MGSLCPGLPRLSGAPWILVVVLAAFDCGRSVALAQSGAEGAFGYRWPGRADPTMYRYAIVRDSGGTAITIYEGMDPAAPSITMPASVLGSLMHRVERYAPPASRAVPTYAEVGMEDGGLLVAFERRLSLALLGLVGSLIAVLGLTIAVRRERRGRAVLVEARRREVESREAERLRLARELHDGPVQLLHLAGLNLAAIECSPGADPRADVAEAVRELRTIAEGLRPPALGHFGIAAALQDLATRFREKHPSIDLDVHIDSQVGELGDSARLAIFRVAQEALSNSAAHAAAAHVALHFTASSRDVELVIEDDGRGGADLDAFASGRSGRFGLLGMCERAQLLGGSLELHSPPGRGTRVRLRVKRASLDAAVQDPVGASA